MRSLFRFIQQRRLNIEMELPGPSMSNLEIPLPSVQQVWYVEPPPPSAVSPLMELECRGKNERVRRYETQQLVTHFNVSGLPVTSKVRLTDGEVTWPTWPHVTLRKNLKYATCETSGVYYIL